ncbi:MAG: tRNA lysidine(34) synthetase TilS [Holosporaceae bacterium]|jgi:tRNA(Ile)-lysidine synthase|nr:tRNA lysidine(34) synthetase TilS [Holosporaceae bacterium]
MHRRIVSEFVDEQSIDDFFAKNLNELFDFYRKHYAYGATTFPKLCVAVSGGSDSLALLFLARSWVQKRGMEVFCITVDHKLRKESLDEAVFVQTICESMQIKHEVLTWNSKSDEIDRGKLENLAREARYRLISEFCAKESIGVVLVGHTWNDQLETFAMRKNCGSSEIGLAGISRIRSLTDDIKLLRPLLYFTRDCLKNFLRSKKITWKEDPMNDNETFQRVLWRKKISSYGVEKISALSDEIMRLGEMRNAVEVKAVAFLRQFCVFPQFCHAIIPLDQFLAEEKATQREILRRIIWSIGGKKYATAISEDLLTKILQGKINTLGRCLLKVKKHEILVLRENRNVKKMPPNPDTDDHIAALRQRRHNISGETLFGLPYLEQSHRIHGGSIDWPSGFANKMNLFDIFL